MKPTYYLLYTLIDFREDISDSHVLYMNLKDAKVAMDKEIEECHENFNRGRVKNDLERLYEFMDEDGRGFTVGIEEMIPQ